MVKKADKAANKADKRNVATAAERRTTKPLPKHNKHNKHSQPSKQAAYTDFATQLASLHLRLQHIEGDGNCLFRSIADQVEGVESNHAHYRQLACTHITEHSELYAPFIDGSDGGKAGEGVRAYVTRMSRMGEWGGNLELVALARALRRDVVVHQLGAPRLVIDGEVKGKSSGGRGGVLHLAYHDAEHYSSVRRADDHSVHTEPLLITLPASNTPTAQQHPPSTAPTSDERRVMAATGIADVGRVRAALRDLAGDVDSAVVVLNAEQDAQWQHEQEPLEDASQVEEKKGEDSARDTIGPIDVTAAYNLSEVSEADEVKEVVKTTSKAKLSTKELKKALKADRAEKKVQRALERKVERMKERAQQAGEAEKGSSPAQAEDGTEGAVQDFGSLSI